MKVDWIPVAERLPDEGEDLFVLVGWWNAMFKSWAVYDEPGSKIEYNVIAWAPLPEPYKGEKRK